MVYNSISIVRLDVYFPLRVHLATRSAAAAAPGTPTTAVAASAGDHVAVHAAACKLRPRQCSAVVDGCHAVRQVATTLRDTYRSKFDVRQQVEQAHPRLIAFHDLGLLTIDIPIASYRLSNHYKNIY